MKGFRASLTTFFALAQQAAEIAERIAPGLAAEMIATSTVPTEDSIAVAAEAAVKKYGEDQGSAAFVLLEPIVIPLVVDAVHKVIAAKVIEIHGATTFAT